MYLFDGGWKRKRERGRRIIQNEQQEAGACGGGVCVVFLASLSRVSKPGKCKQERLPEQRRSGVVMHLFEVDMEARK